MERSRRRRSRRTGKKTTYAPRHRYCDGCSSMYYKKRKRRQAGYGIMKFEGRHLCFSCFMQEKSIAARS